MEHVAIAITNVIAYQHHAACAGNGPATDGNYAADSSPPELQLQALAAQSSTFESLACVCRLGTGTCLPGGSQMLLQAAQHQPCWQSQHCKGACPGGQVNNCLHGSQGEAPCSQVLLCWACSVLRSHSSHPPCHSHHGAPPNCRAPLQVLTINTAGLRNRLISTCLLVENDLLSAYFDPILLHDCILGHNFDCKSLAVALWTLTHLHCHSQHVINSQILTHLHHMRAHS